MSEREIAEETVEEIVEAYKTFFTELLRYLIADLQRVERELGVWWYNPS